MDIWQILLYILLPLLIAYAGFNERDKNNMKHRLNETMDQDEIEHLIELKNRPMEVLQVETAKDIKQCNRKLDKIEDMLRKLQSK